MNDVTFWRLVSLAEFVIGVALIVWALKSRGRK